MDSIRTISCKLQVDPHQAERIEATLQAFADACNFVAEWGCTHKVRFQYALHKGCYQAVRERFSLSANLATLSDDTSFGGKTLKTYRLKRHQVRQSLQSKAETGTQSTRKNARRVLKRLSGKERRYQKWVNHQISKHIVETAKAAHHAIVLEELQGIRERTNKRLRRSQRGLHNSWAFYQLRQFVEYKARRAGVRVISIKPAYTSQMCSCCHHIGNRSRARFSCANCGAVMDADLNGALNIATVGAAVTRPEYSLLSCPLPQWAAEAAG